ncbi:CD48 antigen-like [Neopsephotus bourkii]|uniref:CD48 antigen-like n=1 Tax=Neopsephotus bourkii TaxID=309878 RepID=UPI002AA51E86|nr:CD48 antigen-like [Neopsephotus bourkii]
MAQTGSCGPWGTAACWSLGLDAESRLVAGLTTVLLFFLCITQASQAHQKPSSEVVGAVHGVAYLSPSLQSNISYHEVHWRRNNTLKLASRDGSGEVWYRNNSYRGRLQLFSNNTLKISRLQKSDSSVYQLYMEDETGKGLIESVLLTVYELVPKPTVNAKVIRGDPEQCEATLECSVGLQAVTYEWISHSKIQWSRVSASELHVSLSSSPDTYTCTVSNPVSSNNASLIYTHPCSWTGESSSAASCTITSTLVALALHLLCLLLLTLP